MGIAKVAIPRPCDRLRDRASVHFAGQGWHKPVPSGGSRRSHENHKSVRSGGHTFLSGKGSVIFVGSDLSSTRLVVSLVRASIFREQLLGRGIGLKRKAKSSTYLW